MGTLDGPSLLQALASPVAASRRQSAPGGWGGSQRRLTLLFHWLLALTAWGAVSALDLRAQEVVVVLDPMRTTVGFTLGATLHSVRGTFKLKRGTLAFDTITGRASGEVVVDAASGDSGNSSRDRRMREDVLESQRYPEVVFVADRVEGQLAWQGDSRVTFHGRLLIHGSEHELLLPVLVRSSGGRATATTRFEVPYVAWGMKDPSTFLLRVSGHVGIEIETAGLIPAP